MSEKPPSVSENNESDRFAELLTKTLRQQILNTPPEAGTDEKKVSYILNAMRRRAEEVFPENRQEISALLEEFRDMKFGTIEQFIPAFAQKVAAYLSEKYSIDEIEARMRATLAERSGWTVLNRVLAYEVVEDEVQIHIPTTFTENPMELVKLFDEAMRVLAERLANDPAMLNVRKLSGFSNIAFEKPKLMERLGFTVTEVDNEKKVAHVEMGRDLFIKRYGTN